MHRCASASGWRLSHTQYKSGFRDANAKFSKERWTKELKDLEELVELEMITPDERDMMLTFFYSVPGGPEDPNKTPPPSSSATSSGLIVALGFAHLAL